MRWDLWMRLRSRMSCAGQGCIGAALLQADRCCEEVAVGGSQGLGCCS